MNARKKPAKALFDFETALDALPAHDQEAVLLKASARVRQLRDPCPCESGMTFGDCHGKMEAE
jgi:uncharacterized protein YecA (UPF0149 family)